MTNSPALNFLLQFISLFNAMLLLWLGPSIALHAERPRWFIWLAGGAVMMAGLFFVLHSIILASSIGAILADVRVWWLVGWLPLLFLPASWYGMTLWYSGYVNLEIPTRSLKIELPHLWERVAFVGVIALTLLLGLLFLLSNPLPENAAQLPVLQLLPNILFALLFPIEIILCILLSIYTLRRPRPAVRWMGDEARARARPWLMAVAAALLVVTLLVAWAVLWLLQFGRALTIADLYLERTLQLAWFDVLVAGVIGLAVLALGQGIVAYEVFTGKRFPRNDLRRQWRNAIILSTGFGAVVSAALVLQLRSIYIAVLSVMVIAWFYALLNWRNANARERYIAQLRPIVGSQALVDSLIDMHDAATQQLRALCDYVLQTSLAYVLPLGRFVTLIDKPITYPANAPALPNVPQLDEALREPRTMCVPLDPAKYAALRWAVPLWGQHGLIGLLLLGDKRAGGLYAQEEIEIARINGERLLDTQATAELAQRLMLAQRQRIAESQIADRRTRQVLHDEVLPRLHAAMLSTCDDAAIKALSEAHRDLAQLLRELPAVTQLQLTSRGLFGALRELIEREFAHDFDGVDWAVTPEAAVAAKHLSESQAEVIFHAAREAIRNAARYGRGPQRYLLRLTVGSTLSQPGQLRLWIEDDGVGADHGVPSVGSGNGLALHSAMLAVIGGTLTSAHGANSGTRITLECSTTIKSSAI